MLDFTITFGGFASLSLFNIWTYALTRVWYLSIYTISASRSVRSLGLIVLVFSTSGVQDNKHEPITVT